MSKDVDRSQCKDYAAHMCPYIKGPPVYVAMDGKVKKVSYNPRNVYYGTGPRVGNSSEGKLTIDGTSWGSFGCFVEIENVDGSTSVYAHMYPDKEFMKQLAEEYVGKNITAGTFIGYMGNTGSSTALHLHIEFNPKGQARGTATSLITGEYLKKIAAAMGKEINNW